MEFLNLIQNMVTYTTIKRVVAVLFCTVYLAQSFSTYPRRNNEWYGGGAPSADFDMVYEQPMGNEDLFVRNTRAGIMDNYLFRRKLAKLRKRGQFDALIAKLESLTGSDMDGVRVAPVRFGPGGKRR